MGRYLPLRLRRHVGQPLATSGRGNSSARIGACDAVVSTLSGVAVSIRRVMSKSSHVSKSCESNAVAFVVGALMIGLAACRAGHNDGNQNDSPSTSLALVKNAPLNSCVSVMSGGRPTVGVTIPRCIPTTLPGNPNKPKK